MASRFRINVQRKAAVEVPAAVAAPAPTLPATEALEEAVQEFSQPLGITPAPPRKRARPPYDGGGVPESKGGDPEDEDEHGDVDTAPADEPAAALAIVPFGVSLSDQANAPYVHGAGLAPMARPVAETRHGMRQFVVSQHGVRMFIQ
jgi:hypothetical protein